MSTVEMTCWKCGETVGSAHIDDETEACQECAAEVRFESRVADAGNDAEAAVEALHRLANSAAGREALKRRLERTHRTNQQLVCVAILTMLEKWKADGDKGAGWYDARNEAAVNFACKVFALVPERERYMPYI